MGYAAKRLSALADGLSGIFAIDEMMGNPPEI